MVTASSRHGEVVHDIVKHNLIVQLYAIGIVEWQNHVRRGLVKNVYASVCNAKSIEMKPLTRLRIKGPVRDFLILIPKVCKSCGGPDSIILIIVRNAPGKTSLSMKEISVFEEHSFMTKISLTELPQTLILSFHVLYSGNLCESVIMIRRPGADHYYIRVRSGMPITHLFHAYIVSFLYRSIYTRACSNAACIVA